MPELDFVILRAIFLGFIVGLVLAMSGAGGGIIAVPLLIFFLNLPIQQAAPVGLVAVGLAAGMGAVIAPREGNLRYRAAGLMGIFGIVAAPLGVYSANKLPSKPLMLGFTLILTGLAFKTLRQVNASSQDQTGGKPRIVCQTNAETGRFLWNRPCAGALAITGTISGFLSGLLGVGGGFVIVPTLNRYSNLKTQGSIATSLAVIALVAVSGISAAAMHGSMNWVVTLPFAAGSLTGMIVGNKISTHIHSQRLQQNFAVVCLVAATLLVVRAAGGKIFN
jgi:uncharacterized membrane protein YfcA